MVSFARRSSRKWFAALCFGLALSWAGLGSPHQAEAHGRTRVGIGIGIGAPFWGDPFWDPWYYRPYPAYYGSYSGWPYYGGYPPVYYAPPPVVYAPPPVVMYQQAPAPAQPAPSNRECREFRTTANIGGRSQWVYGTACRQPDGTWQTVSRQ